MKKLFCFFTILISICITDAANADCKSDAEMDIFRIWGFSYNEKVPQKYKDMVEEIINSPVTTASSGECRPGGPYTCTPGQIYKACCPCAEFDAKKTVEEIHTKDYIQEKCGTGTSTNTNIKRPIRGTVFDNNGEPLVGANVIIPGAQYAGGSQCGTSTGTDGAWEISDCINIPSDPKLKITYTGYTTQEIPLSSFRNDNQITLAEDGLTLSDVVVTECAPTNANYPGATDFELASDGKCYPTACDEPRYKLTGTDTSAKCQEQKCEISNAARTEWTGEKNAWKCIVQDCKDKYKKNDDSTACIEMLRECTDEQNAEHPNAAQTGIKSGTETCIALECKPGYEVEKHKCVEIAGNCPDKPENAKKSHREFDSNTQAEVCIIDECNDGYKVSDDGKSCTEIEKPKLSREDSQKKIDELQKNADAMKEKEQSTANKLLGGAAIGATGIGAMQAASAYSEQQADEEAETAMRAYLATFHCNYGGGINVKGGEKDVQLPGGNELIDLYAEYVNLANNLKVRKAALDLRPGIESEAILDSATSGLYDDVAIGKTSGAFTSLARALQDPEGEDAKAWAAQKDASAKKMKTGLTVAGIGAIGGAVGNLLINKDAPKENSKEINAKYEKLKKKLEEDIAAIPPQTAQCPSGTSGSKHPDCTCNDTSKIFNPDTNACDSCSGVKIAQNGKCVCPSDKPLWDNANNQCIALPTSCTPQCTPTEGDHLIVKQDCYCTCSDGYDYQNGKCTCTGENKKEENGKCKTIEIKTEIKEEVITEVIQTFTNTTTNTEVENAVLPAGSLFKIGSHELLSQAQSALSTFVNGLSDNGFSQCALTITGYTDPIGGTQTNKNLSEKRANSVKTYIDRLGNSAITSVTADGKGEENCTCGTRNAIPRDQIDYSNREYIACKDQTDTQTLTGDARFAPCRRVEISANCKKVTTTTETSTSTTPQ